MSWQFDHLMASQSAIGTKPESSSNLISNMAMNMDTSSPSNSSGSYPISSYKNVEDRSIMQSGQQQFHSANSSSFPSHSSEIVDDNEFFQRFLQQKNDETTKGDESQQLQSQDQQNLALVASDNNLLGNLNSPDNNSSTFDYLLSTQNQQSFPWSTYSMAAYSSFGQASMGQRELSNEILSGQSKQLPGTNSANNIQININTSPNVIQRFNNQRDNNASFPQTSRSSDFQSNITSDSVNRSYSSVLNSGSDRSQSQQRLGSIFANPTSQHQLISDTNSQEMNNNDDTVNLQQYQSSLLPTSKQSRYSLPQQRHVNLFNQTSNYQAAFQQASPTNNDSLGDVNQNTVAGAIGYLSQSRLTATITANNIQHQAVFGFSPNQKRLNINNHNNNFNNNNNDNNNGRSGSKFPSIFNDPSANQSLITSSDTQQHSGVFYGGQNLIANYSCSNSNNNDLTNTLANDNNDPDDDGERFSRKVFVGGLPPDIDEEEIKASFRRFGSLIVDWPHKAESKSYFPPKGYAFLLFHEESSVQALIDSCLMEDDKLYLCVSSPTIKDKPVQIRPWRLSDADFVLDSTLALDPRKTVFVGGVPRPLKASELANIMNNLYGGVCYAGIDTDPELKYPKGAGRVAFSNHQSYISAISARFVHLQHSEFEKRVEVKPYVLDDQFCDECQGSRCNNKFAPFFCANIACLQYFCENCWSTIHSQAGKEYHKPLVKEGADRPRGVPTSRWS